MSVRGEPERLEHYSTETTATLPPLRGAIDDYSDAIGALNRSSTDMAVAVADDSDHFHALVGRMQRIDAAPRAFAWALRRLDHSDLGTTDVGGVIEVDDVDLFHRLVDLRVAQPLADGDVIWAEAQAATPQAVEAIDGDGGAGGLVVMGDDEQLRRIDAAAAVQIRASTSVLAGVPALVARLAERVFDMVDTVSKSFAVLVEERPEIATQAVDVEQASMSAPAGATFGLPVPAPDGDDLRRIADGAGRIVGRAVEAGRNVVENAVEAGKSLLGGLFDRAKKVLGRVVETATTVIGGVVDAGRNALGQVVDGARNLAGRALSGLTSLFGGAWDWIVDRFNAVKDAVVGWLQDKVQAFVDALLPYIERLGTWLVEVAWPAIDKWVDEHVDLLETVSTVLQVLSVVADVIGVLMLFSVVLAPFAPIAFGLGRVFAGGALAVDALLAATGNGDWGDVAIDAALLLIPFGRIAKPLLRILKPVLGRILDAVSPVLRALADAAGPLVRRITDALSSVRRWIDETFGSVVRRIREGIESIGDRIRRFWRGIEARRLAREFGGDIPPEVLERLLRQFSVEDLRRLRQSLGAEEFARLANNGTLERLLRAGVTPDEILALANDVGPKGLDIADGLILGKAQPHRALHAARVAKETGTLDDVHELVTSGNLVNPASLPKFLDALAKAQPQVGLRTELEEAALRSRQGHQVALGKSDEGEADVIDITAEEALQIKDLDTPSSEDIARQIRKARNQFLTEVPPPGYDRIVDIRLTRSTGDMATMGREELLDALKALGIDRSYFDVVTTLRIVNKNGDFRFGPEDFS